MPGRRCVVQSSMFQAWVYQFSIISACFRRYVNSRPHGFPFVLFRKIKLNEKTQNFLRYTQTKKEKNYEGGKKNENKKRKKLKN